MLMTFSEIIISCPSTLAALIEELIGTGSAAARGHPAIMLPTSPASGGQLWVGEADEDLLPNRTD